jgi:hypothetical protein
MTEPDTEARRSMFPIAPATAEAPNPGAASRVTGRC